MKMMKQIVLTLCCAAIIGCSTRTEPDQPSGDEKRGTSPVANVMLPSPEEISEFKADPIPAWSHWAEFKIDRTAFLKVLTTWHQVSSEHWRLGYSHVGLEDRTGTIRLKDGTSIRWMVKPGGLAYLSLPSGETIFLAKELSRWKGTAESGSGEH